MKTTPKTKNSRKQEEQLNQLKKHWKVRTKLISEKDRLKRTEDYQIWTGMYLMDKSTINRFQNQWEQEEAIADTCQQIRPELNAREEDLTGRDEALKRLRGPRGP